MKALRMVGMGALGMCLAAQVSGTAEAALLCAPKSGGTVAMRSVCKSGENAVDLASLGAGPGRAFHRAVDRVDIPSVGWNYVAPVANVFVSEPGRYVIVATANVRAVGNGDYVQCELWARGRSRDRSVSVVKGLWTGEAIALSTVDTFTAPGSVDLRCTDVESSKDAFLTDVRLTAFRVAPEPPPFTVVVGSMYDLEATGCSSVKNHGPGTSPATTVGFSSCSATVSIPALAPGAIHSFSIPSGCGNGFFFIDPQGLLNQERSNDHTSSHCIF